MAKIFGAVAAGVALCTQLTQFGIAIHKATKDIRNSRRDIVKLADETILFASSSEDFLRSCADDYQAKSSATYSIRPLTTWISKTKTGLFRLLQNVEALQSNPKDRPSLQNVLIAYLKWHFSKKEVKCLRVSLSIARASMNGYSNLICIRKLEEELQLLRRALDNAASRVEIEEKFGMSIEDKIELIEEAIKIKTTVHRTNKRIMRDSMEQLELKQQKIQTSDFVSAPPDDLFQFTDSLRRCSQDFMPSSVSKRSPLAANHASSLSSSTESTKRRREGHWQNLPVDRTPEIRTTRSRRSSLRPSASHSRPTNGSSEGSIPSLAVLLEHLSATTSSAESSNAARRSTGNTRHPSVGGIESGATDSSAGKHNANDEVSSLPSTGQLNDVTLPRSARVGRYTVILDAHDFRIHDQRLKVTNYASGNAFFNAVLRHKDKVDAVVHALSSRDEGVVFDGIPGWLVDSSGAHAQADV